MCYKFIVLDWNWNLKNLGFEPDQDPEIQLKIVSKATRLLIIIEPYDCGKIIVVKKK